MSSSWVEEPAKGRYYVEKDQYGRSVRVYEDEYGEESSAPNREPADRQFTEETPRQLATNKPGYRVSQYQSSTRARRESETSTKRGSDSGNQDLSRPVAIRSERSYHDEGGYDRVREGPSFQSSRSNSYVAHDEEERIHGSSLDRPGAYRSTRARDEIHGSGLDPLAGSLGKLTLDDVSRDGQYTISRSERRGSDVHHSQSGARVEDDRDLHAPSYESKGKSKETEDRLSPAQSLSSHHIRGTRGEAEKLDKSYIIRRQDYLKFFKPGRIFSTLWTDPYGGTANESENSQFMTRVDYVSYGERVHTKIRRFVVVRQGDRCCTCLPVTTYDGKGYKKRGIKLSDHGLIYSEKHPGEVEGITKKALFVRLSKNGEKLRNPSYINYGRIYTVDTNVKVKDVGELDSESRRLLVTYYKDVHFPEEDYDGLSPTQTPQSRAATLAGVGSGLAPPHGYSGSQPMMRTPSMVSSTVTPSDYTASDSYHPSATYAGGPDPRWEPSSGFNPMAPMPPPSRTFDSQFVSAQHPSNPEGRYAMQRTSSSSGYQPPDPRFSKNAFPGTGLASQSYPTQPPAPGPIYPPRESQYPDSYQGQQPPFSSRGGPLPAGGHYSQSGYQGAQPINTYGAPNPPAFPPSQSRGYYPPPSNSAGWASQPPPPSSRQSVEVYEDDELLLPTLEEAQANRRRRDSVSGRHRQSRR